MKIAKEGKVGASYRRKNVYSINNRTTGETRRVKKEK